MGIGQGIQPLLRYSCGSGDRKRFGSTLKCSLIFATAVGCIMTAPCYLFDHQIAAAFLADASALNYAERFSKIMICTRPIFVIMYVVLNAIQAMGAAMPALIVNLSRQGLAYIPALYIMGRVLGAEGLAWAQPIHLRNGYLL